MKRVLDTFERRPDLRSSEPDCRGGLGRAARASAPFSFSSRNPRSKPVIASAASTTAASTSSVDSEFWSARATSTRARSFARLPAPGGSRFRRGELIEQFLDLVVVERENQAVGIGKSELDPIGRIQFLSRDARPVDEHAMAALQILDIVFAVFRDDPGVVARSSVVAEDQVIVRLPADRETESGVIGIRLRFPEGLMTTSVAGRAMIGARGILRRTGPSRYFGRCGPGSRQLPSSPALEGPGSADNSRRLRCGPARPQTRNAASICLRSLFSGSPKNSSTLPQRRQMMCACSCFRRVS